MPATARTSSRSSSSAQTKRTDEPEEDKPPLQDDTNTNQSSSKFKVAKKKTVTTKTTKTKMAASTKRKKAVKAENDEDATSVTSATQESPQKRTKKAPTKANDDNDEPSQEGRKKKPAVQCITERDDLPKLWTDVQAKENGSYTLRIGSWNVAGLRALLKKDPDVLGKLVQQHNLDVLCLQETKLQEIHLDDPKLKIRGHLLQTQGYDAYYSCSYAKLGYAGTAVFVKRRGGSSTKTKSKQKSIDSFFGSSNKTKDQPTTTSDHPLPVDPKLLIPEKVSYQLEGTEQQHNDEGRIIVLEFPGFTMANLYVPNSGQKLERLQYRTEEWDKELVAWALQHKKERNVPVLWCGDLNVAHKEWEAYNFGAKHLDKQAGLTLQERASFQAQLDTTGFVDAFRHLHPTAKGHYTYWSQRAGNREPNKGLRLDYFVCDPTFFPEDSTSTTSKVIARDSYMIPEQMGSDHCPVVLELEIKA